MKLKTVITLAMLIFTTHAMAATYSLDTAHSTVGFSVKHMVVSKVRGNFNKFEGTFDFDEKKSEVSKVNVKIDAASIDTNDKKRDEHLNSPDFFDSKKYPQITFVSDKPVVVKKDAATKIEGKLTMHGVTKPVVLDVTYGGAIKAGDNEKVGFSLSGKLNRKDFGMAWNKALDQGGLAVSDEVVLEIEGEANKSK